MARAAIPTLRTARLVLRAFRAEDFDRFAAMEANPAVTHFTYGSPRSRIQAWEDMACCLGQWDLRGYGKFAVADAAGSLIGQAGLLHLADWPEAEISYALDQPWWGQGFATEAVTAIRDWAFANYPFARLASFIAPANLGSQRVAAKLGAVRDGMLELRGRPVERWLYFPPGRGPVA